MALSSGIKGGKNMQTKAAGKVLVVVIALISLGSMFACAGKEFAPKDPYPYWYYPKELTDADRALEAARQKGKDKECPKEFAEAKASIDRAYAEYMTCKTPGPIPINIVCPAPTCELRTDRGKIDLGESVTLTMTTSGYATSATIDGTEVAPTGGTKTVTPTSTTTYTATIVGSRGSIPCSSVAVQVIPPPPPTCELKADRGKIEVGESVTLSLTTSGKVTSAVLDGTEVAPAGGTKKIEPASAARFTAKVVGPGGSNTCSVPVSMRLILYVHFPFDRPKAGEDAKWFGNPDANNPEDLKDPANKGKSKSPFMNSELKDNPAELKKAVDFVKANTGSSITVTGHTDGKGTEQYNRSLSERRAIAVKEYLINQQVIDRKKITAKGLGETQHIAKETTPDGKDDPAGRAKNRRVEIISEAASPR
jgi:hypothetical protein